MSTEAGRLLFYAPNVHTGGGLVLLQAVLAAWPAGRPLRAWLDERARERLQLPAASEVTWVSPRIGSRLAAEFSLASAGRSEDRVLCFHGLPPLLRNAAPLFLFLQNRLFLGQMPLRSFRWKTRVRLRCEEGISRLLRHRIAAYWVQTPSMARALQAWYGPEAAKVHVLPFAPPYSPAADRAAQAPCWDFVYVADGEAHKNHRVLVEAWALLAAQGLRPSLALTLPPRDAALSAWIAERSAAAGLQIHDLASLSHAQVLALYGQARALVFPSISESFGLPLIEARNAGLPILAGELDFVRDVCEPVQSFDPGSAVSIARAVRRFLQKAEAPLLPVGAADFLRALFDEAA